MIKPISFTGKAYFLDSALKTLTSEQKKRIENYASKKDEDTDVVVIGQETEFFYDYKGERYPYNGPIEYDCGRYIMETEDSTEELDEDDVEIIEEPIPVYNAYILYDYNKENVTLPHDKKVFDFSQKRPSTIISHRDIEKEDIPY